MLAQGWAKSQNLLNLVLKHCYNITDELTVVNNLIIKDNKIVVLSTLLKEMKQNQHTGYLSIERTISNVR